MAHCGPGLSRVISLHPSGDLIRNALPIFLETLAVSLSAVESHTNHRDVREVEREHGQQRAALTEYTLRNMLREYQVLLEQDDERAQLFKKFQRTASAKASVNREGNRGDSSWECACQKHCEAWHEFHR